MEENRRGGLNILTLFTLWIISFDRLFKMEEEDSIRFPTTGSSITGIAVLYFVSWLADLINILNSLGALSSEWRSPAIKFLFCFGKLIILRGRYALEGTICVESYGKWVKGFWQISITLRNRKCLRKLKILGSIVPCSLRLLRSDKRAKEPEVTRRILNK